MAAYFLTTKRLGFRSWNETDNDLAFGLWGDFEITKFIDARGQLSMEQVQEILTKELATARTYGVQYWPVFLLGSGEHVGCCGLRPYKVSEKVYELGVHIRSKFWREGFGTEAVRGIMEYAFTTLGVSALFAGHNPRNESSRSLLDKLGFKYTHTEYYSPTGLHHPSYLLTAQDYANLKTKTEAPTDDPGKRHSQK
ncbi:MAG: GNAT family N-acetyltransferase [Ignavibacteriales bacterium]|nr:GNAT family N-acetyltransferase [Ignavibacteriales bacterium]MBI3004206.1 GNAT family N-acetyltransferase [Ignavibacteriales bacterium]